LPTISQVAEPALTDRAAKIKHPFPILGLKRIVAYRLIIPKLPPAEDLNHFLFAGTPIRPGSAKTAAPAGAWRRAEAAAEAQTRLHVIAITSSRIHYLS
jgi:hypothetical protein